MIFAPLIAALEGLVSDLGNWLASIVIAFQQALALFGL
jgi:hypothetical protein